MITSPNNDVRTLPPSRALRPEPVAAAAVALEGGPPLRQVLDVPDRGIERRRDPRGRMVTRVLLLADAVAIPPAVALTMAYADIEATVSTLLLLTLAGMLLWMALAGARRLYHVDSLKSDHRVGDELGSLLLTATVWSWGLTVIGSFAGFASLPVDTLAVLWAGSVALVTVSRAIGRAWARRQVWYLQNAVVLGTGEQASGIVRRILRHPEFGINVVACVGAADGDDSTEVAYMGPVPMIRGEVDVLELVDELDVDRVIAATAIDGDGELLSRLSDVGVHIDLVTSWTEVVGARVELHAIEGVPLMTVPYARLSRSATLAKRSFDLAVATCAVVVLSPLLLLCALLIKLDSRGPVFFRQSRVGKDDTSFDVFKFRSMYVDAEAKKEAVAAMSFHGGGTETGMFKIEHDPRVTRAGRFLRRTSLDELPQLFNVVAGDMSLVGPRPLIENEHRQVTGRFRRRSCLPPGLTGLWQVHGRSDIPFTDMVNLDYIYATSWSLWGDIKLIMRTFSAVLRGQGAY